MAQLLEWTTKTIPVWQLVSDKTEIKQHAETTTHDIDPNYMEIKEKGVNDLRQCHFLQSWHSKADENSINERKDFLRL